MKRLIFIVIVLTMVSQLWAGDIYDETVKRRETKTRVIYYGTVVFGASDLEDNHFTQFFQIDDCNASGKDGLYPTIGAVCSNVAGTEDVNVIAHYSMNMDTSIVSSLNSGVVIDQVVTTMLIDTLNYHTGAADAYFQGARFMRLNFDGQSSNPATTLSNFDGQSSNPATTLSWWVSLVKNDPNVGAEKQVLDHKAGAGILALLLILGGLYFKKRRST